MKRLLITVSVLFIAGLPLISCKQRSQASQVLDQDPASLHGAIVFLGHESQAQFMKEKILPALSDDNFNIVELYVDDGGDFNASSKKGTINIPYNEVGDIIKNAKWNIALIGSKSVANDEVRNTWSMAKEISMAPSKKNLLPITIEKVPADSVPLYIRTLTSLDMTGSSDAQNRSLDRLVKALKSK